MATFTTDPGIRAFPFTGFSGGFEMVDLDFQRMPFDGPQVPEDISDTFYNVESALDFIENQRLAGWTLTNVEVWV